jgi:2-dehydro-3-deoxyphosphogluconate aldolase/(4S)-4-hydroxy-2-oxoglutarate aldolase
MTKEEIVDLICRTKVITIIRTNYPDKIIDVVKILVDEKLPVLEVTSNTPSYLSVIQQVRQEMPEAIIGAGTITNTSQAKEAIEAGAMFLVTPITSKEILDYAADFQVPVAMGAFSPTEIHNAVAWGADFVKLFPADHLGPSYLKAVKATLPDVNFVPTGGVRLETLGEWIEAGAMVFGLGGGIVSNADLLNNDFQEVRRKASTFRKHLEKYKGQ